MITNDNLRKDINIFFENMSDLINKKHHIFVELGYYGYHTTGHKGFLCLIIENIEIPPEDIIKKNSNINYLSKKEVLNVIGKNVISKDLNKTYDAYDPNIESIMLIIVNIKSQICFIRPLKIIADLKLINDIKKLYKEREIHKYDFGFCSKKKLRNIQNKIFK